MNKSTSLYLDFLRVIAAFGVLLVHANQSWFSNDLFLRADLGHRLVMIFFVLSGYLIAFTVDKKNKGSQRYLIDRFSRLYSVVLPALIFTYTLDFIGRTLHPAFYVDKINADHPALRFLLNLTYMQQAWSLCTKPSSNTPFWSIGYEFWYYMFFWAICYFKGATRYLLAIAVWLIVGLKVLLLLPVWLMGAWAYKKSTDRPISSGAAMVLFIATGVIILLFTFVWDISFFSKQFDFGRPPLFFSSQFLFDWFYGLLIAINIYSFSFLNFAFKMPDVAIRAVKYLSSVTFTLYLFHIPMLYFAASVLHYDKSSYLQVVPILLVIVLMVNLFAMISEKQRGHFKTFFEKVFSKFHLSPDAK